MSLNEYKGRAGRRRKKRENAAAAARGEYPVPAHGEDVDVGWDGKRYVAIRNVVMVCAGCNGALSLVPNAAEVIAPDAPHSYLFCQVCLAVVPPEEAAQAAAGMSRVAVQLFEKLSLGSHPTAVRISEGSKLLGPDGRPL